MQTRSSTTRFADRADNYDLYRPGYPPAVIPYLEQTVGLNEKSIIADIGSGTGIFSALFLDAGYSVLAVEPNAAMRSLAIKNLQHCKGFQSIEGTAEETSLTSNSIDLITVAQAFHWFEPEAVKQEFKRILQPGGYVLLVWNILQTDTPFLKTYAALKNKYAEQDAHPEQANPESVRQFFHPNPVLAHKIRNIQWRDAEGLKGLLLSSSKIPLPDDSRYANMITELETLSAQYAENGLLKMEYDTMLYLAQTGENS